MITKIFAFGIVLVVLMAVAVPSIAATTVYYGDVSLSGGFQAGHFADVWDLTAEDMTISFTYDANGLVDDSGCHAWSELGVRSVLPKKVDLIAGQNKVVGYVEVWRDGDALYVKYVITEDGWAITETHADAGDALTDIPQKNGNPIPGKFEHNMKHEPPVTVYTTDPPLDVSGEGNNLYIAAHAKVIHITEGCIDIASDTTIGVTPTVAPWDTMGLRYAGDRFTFPTAQWIWTTEVTSDPVNGEIVEFTKTFTIPGMYFLEKSGNLYVTCDNGYELKVNDVLIGRAQLAENFREVPLTNDIVWWYDSVSPPYSCGGPPYGWQTVESWDISGALKTGTNTLQLTGVNEADTADECPPGVGTIDTNPAGCKFEAIGGVCYKVVDREETAWGAGKKFPGKNWATYIDYTYTEVKDFNPTWMTEGSGVWLATDYDWTVNTFDPDPVGSPTLDLDDKLILQKGGGMDEGYYNLPSTPSDP